MTSYLFDAEWDRERRRLEGLCSIYDPGTLELLTRMNLRPGARCLEVGAGTGSIARWLARTLNGGQVVATDVDTRFLEREDLTGIELRRHDIVNDPIEASSFDLIHVRALLMHLPERKRAIDNMFAALRPGGTLLLEDVIPAHAACSPELQAWRKMIEAFMAAFEHVGAEPAYGIKLCSELRSRCKVAPCFEVRAPLVYGATPGAEFLGLCLEQLRPLLLRLDLMSEGEIEAVLTALSEPERILLPPLMAAAWVTLPS